jgi:hypothetical protein
MGWLKILNSIQYKNSLALMQGKNLAFFASFGKAAGIRFLDKARAIRS